jgi:hypothetical protein
MAEMKLGRWWWSAVKHSKNGVVVPLTGALVLTGVRQNGD